MATPAISAGMTAAGSQRDRVFRIRVFSMTTYLCCGDPWINATSPRL
jgi:hypothetical protein